MTWLMSKRTGANVVLIVVACATLPACSSEPEADPTTPALSPEASPGLAPPDVQALRIYHDPYRGVGWEDDLRMVTQMHDHVGNDTLRIKAYDDAGYDVVSLLDYSGVVADDTRRERIWPPERVLPPGYPSRLKNIDLFIPNAEESGFDHLTSPFLETYIERWDPRYLPERGSYHYYSTQEAITLIDGMGGVAIIAHPWLARRYGELDGFAGVEIYNAYGAFQERAGSHQLIGGHRDASRVMLALWDEMLTRDPTVLGIAVNDHFGPYSRWVGPGDPLRDSGKIVVFAKDASLEAFRTAFEHGTFVAVRDLGSRKNEYPFVRSIVAAVGGIEIDAGGAVEWIANGTRVGSGPRVALRDLAAGYVRAEITDANGSTVYTQAFSIRPVGDIDGDGYVAASDEDLCAAIRLGEASSDDALVSCLGLD